jgi:hypothetical protein
VELKLVSDYIGQARVLLQDTVQPFRYDAEGLVTALNNCWLEVERVRPDILLNWKYKQRQLRRQTISDIEPPVYSVANQSERVWIPAAYRTSLLYYICGFAQIRDMEDVQDARANLFLDKFAKLMLGVA